MSAGAARRSFPRRLSLAVFAFSLTVVAFGGVASYRAAADTLRDRLLAQLSRDAADRAEIVSDWLLVQRRALEVEAAEFARDGVRPPTDPDGGRIPMVVGSLLQAEEVFLARVPGGAVVRSSDAAGVGRFVVDELFYARGRESTFVQNVYPSGTSARPRLTIATPVRMRDSVVAVLAAHLDLTRLETAVQRVQATQPSVEAYLVNRTADFVSARRFGRDNLRRGVHSVAVDSGRLGGTGAGLYLNYAGREVVGAWHYLPELALALIVESPRDEALAPARRLLVQTLLLGLLATGLLALGVTSITRRFSTPVLSVADAAARVAAGDFGVRAPEDGEDEVGQLARAFNVMTARLESLYGSLGAQVQATQQALDAAQSTRALLQDLMNNAATLVLVVDDEQRVRFTNERAAWLAGVAPAAAAGRTLHDLYGEQASRLVPLVARAREDDTGIEQELDLGRDGDPHGWQVVAFPLRRADGSAYAVGIIGTDLTERARAETERRARDASVQQAQKLESLGVMAGGIAHDFNNILGAILGNVELARDALGAPPSAPPDTTRAAPPADAMASLDRIRVAGRRAAELTRQLLAYAGRASLRREVVDVRRVIEDIVPIVQASQPKKVRVEVAPMPEVMPVELDPSQLSQVLLNLLTNAAEAIGDDTGTVTLRAVFERPPLEDVEGRWLRLSVSDTGPGIPEAVRDRIFDPFFTTKASGRGLGLSAVRGIVRSLGGVLEYGSPVEGGTRFDIFLRAADATEVPQRAPARAADAPRLAGTLLVVDDEQPIRDVVARVATRIGLTVLEAGDGASGLAHFRTRPDEVQVVWLDLSMPGMGGAEVLRELRRTHPGLPVIIASGYDRDDVLPSIDEDPATTFLPKPFGTDVLRQRLVDALARG